MENEFEYKEFTESDTEGAIKKAVEHFQMPMNRLEVEVVSAGSSGFLGIFGAKKAVIRARPNVSDSAEDVASVVKELRSDSVKKDGWDREREDQRAKEREKREPLRQREEYIARNNEENDPEVIESAKEATKRIVNTLDGGCNITAEGGSKGIRIEIEGGETGIIIGRRGQTLDALQYLVTRIISHKEGRPVKINLDAGGYRRRRKESLISLAERMAEKALMSHRPVAVGPFNSPERRIVHLALKSRQEVSTTSRGRGELKKVVISPR